MDILPTEILEDILIRLSQRNKSTCLTVCKKWNITISYEPSFYSTIEIHSLEQLKKCIEYGKISSISSVQKKDKPFSHRVQHIKTDMIYTIRNDIFINLILTFPYLQTVTGFVFYYRKKREPNSLLPPLLEHATSLCLWYTKGLYGHDWMTTKLLVDYNKLTILDFYIDLSLMLIDESSHPSIDSSSTSPIYFLPIGPIQEKRITTYNSDGEHVLTEVMNYQCRKLMIQPILIQLTKLTIRFILYIGDNTSIYDLDERTFESIHQSCPHLETLYLYDFHMNISEDYQNRHSSNHPLYQQNNTLKSLEIMGTLHDPLCYTYLSYKYQKSLTWLNLSLIWQSKLTKKEHQLIQQSFYDMIIQYHLLSHLSFHFRNQDYLCKQHYLPTEKFIFWLSSHGVEHLNYLSIPFPLSDLETLEPNLYFNNKEDTAPPQQQQGEKEEMKKDESNFIFDNDDIKKMILQNDYLNYLKQIVLTKKATHIMKNRNYLNHLKSFTLTISENINNELYYLLRNIYDKSGPMVVSNTIEELEIYDIFIKNASGFYIYLWLDLFPNLNSLKLKRLYRVKDYIDDMDQINTTTSLHNKQIYDYYLVRKQQKQQYKLKTLDIQKCHLYLIDGFDSLFKKCSQLKDIILVNNIYYHTDWLSDRNVDEVMEKNSIDLSHIHLNRLVIINLKYASWLKVRTSTPRIITELKIHELSLKKQYTLDEENQYREQTTTIPTTTNQSYLRQQDQVYFDRYNCTPKSVFIDIETIPAFLTIQSQSIDKIVFYNDYTFHLFYTR